ncbi:unnamed protein product [Peronospora destructor]|uniref:Nudix hydrolase domain-containing protein n=1 Tax=Peronospora destructor TaxID=86335 RepID=A0AAV0UE95_9STRA|nr:unnamed protein product [Peronospora destructor]
MGLFFLMILTLFLPSCAGVTLHLLDDFGGLSEAAESSAKVDFAKVDFAKLWPKAIDSYDPNKLTAHDVKSLNRDYKIEAAKEHAPKEVIMKGKKEIIKLFQLEKRMELFSSIGLSDEALSRLLLLESERGRRWDNYDLLHKQSGTSMRLKRSDQEIQEIQKIHGREGSVSPLLFSSFGREAQLISPEGEKVMSFCNILRRKDGSPLVGLRKGEKGLWFAEEHEVEMILISSSNQADTKYIVVKGGRNEGESPEQAALRETLEECGIEATIRYRLEDMVVNKGKGEKSRLETWIMDAGNGEGSKYGKKEGEKVAKQHVFYSEDSRLRVALGFGDAVTLVKNRDLKMAENVERIRPLFGTRLSDADAAEFANTKLKIPEEKKP